MLSCRLKSLKLGLQSEDYWSKWSPCSFLEGDGCLTSLTHLTLNPGQKYSDKSFIIGNHTPSIKHCGSKRCNILTCTMLYEQRQKVPYYRQVLEFFIYSVRSSFIRKVTVLRSIGIINNDRPFFCHTQSMRVILMTIWSIYTELDFKKLQASLQLSHSQHPPAASDISNS